MKRPKTVIHILDMSSHRLSDVVRSLVNSASYRQQVERTIVVGFADDNCGCWYNPGLTDSGVETLYSSKGKSNDPRYQALFEGLAAKFSVDYIYGRRALESVESQPGGAIEFVLIDPQHADIHPVNALKGWMFEEFGIESICYEQNEEYERLVRLAPAALGVIRALLRPSPTNPPVIVSHDITGLPTALAAALDPLGLFKTMYCAHRVPLVRSIVEGHPGHDLMYHALYDWARKQDYYLSDLFGSQDRSYEYALIGAARFCDNIVAMSRRIKDGLHFFSPHLKDARIDLMFQGVRVTPVSFGEKDHARRKVRQMALKEFGVCPDYIVIRRDHLDTANAIWRDFRVLAALNQELVDAGRTAVYILAPPEIGQERGDNDRLCPMTARQYWTEWFKQFNQHNTHIKIMIWDSNGVERQAEDGVTVGDILLAGDIELSQNIYRPSCTRPLQTVAVGGICVASDACGLNGLLAEVADADDGTRRFGPARLTALDLVVRAEYASDSDASRDRKSIMQMGQAHRDQVEDRVARDVARIVFERLPQSESELHERMVHGRELLETVTWDALCERFFMPALDYAFTHHQYRSIA